ncbi:FliH/SctL family protein [Helicobacter pametensis]|uniref:FliH/SctL family protein n=1 Tax=Helicobacter pametensis TaxID=95149 RepID=UPI00054FE53A|nr:FliH/SctL family protein [Helicobacter pametensis]
MNSLNNTQGNNFITQSDQDKHVIKKYEFRNMDKQLEAQIAPAMEENGFYTPSNQEDSTQERLELLQGQLAKSIEENQKIFQKLEFLQDLLQKQNQIDPSIFEEIKTSSYQQGLLEGEEKIRNQLSAELQEQKEKLVLAIKQLEEVSTRMQEQIGQIQNDLHTIALDLAKEVIIKEVQDHASHIALSIATELLKPLENSTAITLKANPLDLPFLQEKLSSTQKIHFEPDSMISRGGVIISSPDGNLDGSILTRYKNLKRMILDEKGL